MKIVNLTQHAATAEQVAAGVVEVPVQYREELRRLLTFDTLPTREEVEARATAIASHALEGYYCLHSGCILPVPASGYEEEVFHQAAMIGGAPFLMAALERALARQGTRAVYAFSRRESVEEAQADGSVRKVAVFRHEGFVEA